MSGMLEAKYRCSKCQWPYPYMTPGGKCPCGGDLVDINQFLKNADDIWDQSVCESFPCVIAHEYNRLHELSKGNNIYGVFLQLRDVIETTLKSIVLLAIAWGKEKKIKGREDAYEKFLAVPNLSLGAWNSLAADYLIPFYDELVGTPDALPASLWEILSVITTWITDNKLITWRNEKLGHGAIGFDDDPEFQKELHNIIRTISNFYEEHYAAFSSIQLASDHSILHGYLNARNLDKEDGDCSAFIDGQEISTIPLIIHTEHGIYFFDEVKKKSRLRMLNYQTGYEKIWPNEYAADLLKMGKDQTLFLQASVESEFMTRAENDFLTRLGDPEEFVEPEYITRWLQKDVLRNHRKGVFLIEMERGCGKSVYTTRLNRRFRGAIELAKDLDVRTYHLGRTQTGGPREFTQGIMEEWNSAFVDGKQKDEEKIAGADLKRYAVLEEDHESPENNSLMLADYLNKLREFTSTCYARDRKKRIMLVLDGLDEINESNDKIWSFLPNSEMLDDGVYILLTTRKASKRELPQKYWEHLAKLQVPKKNRLSIYANSPENRAFLEKYIKKQGIKNLDDKKINGMISLAENRILYLSLLCSQLKTIGAIDFSREKRDEIIRSYLNMIENRYSETQRALFRRTLCVLSCVACFESLTLQEIAQIHNQDTISFALLDIITDLLPLLRVDRGLITDEGIVASANRFSLRDDDVIRIVKNLYSNEKDFYIISKVNSLRDEWLTGDYRFSISMGSLAILSHYIQFIQQSGEKLDVKLKDFDLCYSYSTVAMELYGTENGICNQRELNLLRQTVSIHKMLSENDKVASAENAWHVCVELSDKLKKLYYFEESAKVLEYAESLLEFLDINEIEVATMYYSLAGLYETIGSSHAEDCYLESLKLFGNYNQDPQCAKMHAGIQIRLARLYADYQRLDEATEWFESAIKELKLLEKNDSSLYEMIMAAQTSLADAYMNYGRGDLAEKMLRNAREYYSDTLDDMTADLMCSLAHTDCELAEIIQQKDPSNSGYEETYSVLAEALTLYMQASEDGKNTDLDLAKVHNNLGKVCRLLEKNNEAFDHYQVAIQVYETYAKKSPAAYEVDVAMTSMNIANLMFGNLKDREDDALTYYEKAYEIYQKYYQSNPGRFSADYARISYNYGSYCLKWKGNLYEAIDHLTIARKLYQQLFVHNPAAFRELYIICLYNLGLAYQLMVSWNDKEALKYYAEYCRLTIESGPITNSEVLEFAKMVDEASVNFVLCPERSMTSENGWSKDSKEKLLRNRKGSGHTIPAVEVRKLAQEEFARLSEFNLSDAKKEVNLVKMYNAQIIEALSQAEIVNGDLEEFALEVKSLRNRGLYADACALIKDHISSSHMMTTGTAEELFNVLAASGALRDAIDLVTYLFDKCKNGTLTYDEHMSTISNMRFSFFVGIEEYRGLKLIPLLSYLSENDNYNIHEEDLDITLRTGQFLPIIEETIKNNPLADELIDEFLNLQNMSDGYSDHSNKELVRNRDRFDLKGKMHWLFVSDYSGSDAQELEDILVLIKRQGTMFPEIYLSRESLVSVIETGNESSFFNSLLELINGREICFVFKRGGGSLIQKTMKELYEEAKAGGLSDEEAQNKAFADSLASGLVSGYKWNRIFDELGLRGNLLETIEDKDSEWVGDFFEKLLDYAMEKYPDSFED